MNDIIRNKIKEIVEEQTNIEDNDKNIINKIYKEAWKFVLAQFLNSDYHFIPLLFFAKYGEKNNDNVNKAIELLKQDGFYIDEKSNIQALRIKKEVILAYANNDTSTYANTKKDRKRLVIMNNNVRKELLQLIYLKIWNLSLAQIENNNQGGYVWYIKSKDNNGMLYCHVAEELIKEEIALLTEEEEKEIIGALNDDGFETAKTKNGNILITITKDMAYKSTKESTNKK